MTDETSDADCGNYGSCASDRSRGLCFQSERISTSERFSDCFGNDHKSYSNKSGHSDADKPTLSDADYHDYSAACHPYAYIRTVQLQRSRSRLQGLCDTGAGTSVLQLL
jgi:hypothetical protein